MTKKILYGTSNFEAIIDDNGYYVDKTQFIEKLESLGAKYVLFLRPRRFGKSLFISTLEHYYDINRAEQFDELFGRLYIGKNPTPLKNSFPILKFNFSGVISQGTVEEIENSFNVRVWSCLNSFFERYQSTLRVVNIMESQITPLKKASDMLARFIDFMADNEVKYYLLIDEYDNFANNILADHGKDRYHKITHGTGFLRNFFTIIKSGTDSRTVEKMFATGVSPLVMSDVTSGFNMGENISTNPNFVEMAGFTQSEVETVVDYYVAEKKIKKEDQSAMLQILKKVANNYRFSANSDTEVYNSNAVLYYIYQYMQINALPKDVIDTNMRTDYQKLRFLVLESQKLNGNFNLLSEVLETNEIRSELVRNFPVTDLIERDKFVSFLYYLGFLTIKSEKVGQYLFTVANDMCREMLWEYVRKALKDSYSLDLWQLNDAYWKMTENGEWEPLFNYIFAEFYKISSNRDFIYREQGIKGFLLAYLNMSKAYTIHSETEMNKGYADIYIQPSVLIYPEMCPTHFIVELKYLTKADLKESSIEAHFSQAKSQLEQYGKDQKVPAAAVKLIALSTNEELLLLKAF